jgi:hypothetical protein
MGSVTNENGERASIGQEISGKRFMAHCMAQSNDEFGPIEKIILYTGDLRRRSEMARIFSAGPDFPQAKATHIQNIPVDATSPFYLRWEAASQKDRKSYYAYTNPIWLHPIRS